MIYIFFLVYFPHIECKFHGTNVLFTSIPPAPNMELVMNKHINQMWVIKKLPVLWGYRPTYHLSGDCRSMPLEKLLLYGMHSSIAPCLMVKLSSSFSFQLWLTSSWRPSLMYNSIPSTAIFTIVNTMPWGAGLVWWLKKQALQSNWLISITGFSSY